ncbi:MAG TPA: biopolymer transporter ExbD [Flavobacteriales bacterium]|nr:biopolymer transporter ExbD [Flavobacteriales bacterium]HIA13176.1 biopolymer transporter ExbD [Flavobacteriales bacterium]HIO72409.1 biopolymer transporter ExbD [Flavobacteriales bacterium]
MARKKRGLEEINAGSMADIAFLLLIFFLVTTTMDVDSGLLRKLPPPLDPEAPKPPPIKERNVFAVLVNRNDQLLVEGEIGNLKTLRAKAIEFVTNPYNKANLSAKKPAQDIELIGMYEVSKGVVSLQNDRGTSYDMYIMVQNELVAAYREVRDDLSMQTFGKKYGTLNKAQAKAVRQAIPMMISEAEPRNISS